MISTLTERREQAVNDVAQMSREQIQEEILNFQGRFKLDFSPEFLQAQSLERLRHILLAAKLQQLQGRN